MAITLYVFNTITGKRSGASLTADGDKITASNPVLERAVRGLMGREKLTAEAAAKQLDGHSNGYVVWSSKESIPKAPGWVSGGG